MDQIDQPATPAPVNKPPAPLRLDDWIVWDDIITYRCEQVTNIGQHKITYRVGNCARFMPKSAILFHGRKGLARALCDQLNAARDARNTYTRDAERLYAIARQGAIDNAKKQQREGN